MNNIVRTAFRLLAPAALLVMVACSSNPDPLAGGGGSEVEITGMVHTPQGLPRSGVLVRALDKEYVPGATPATAVLLDTTDTAGAFRFSGIAAGTYNIEFERREDSTAAFVRNVAAAEGSVQLAAVSLGARGTALVFVPPAALLAGDLFMPGTTTRVSVSSLTIDPLSGLSVVPGLAPGMLPALAYTDSTGSYQSLSSNDTMEIVSGDSAIAGTVPAPWFAASVGTETPSGGAGYANGVFAIAGGGRDIWGYSDAFQYVCQPMTGDGAITARVVAMDNLGSAKACLMMRASLFDSSLNAAMVYEPNPKVCLTWRNAPADSTHMERLAADSLAALPFWIKLERVGDTLNGYFSADGVAWTLQGKQAVQLPPTVYAGIGVTSWRVGVLCTAQFDNVGIQQ